MAHRSITAARGDVSSKDKNGENQTFPCAMCAFRTRMPRSGIMCQIETSRLNQVCHPSVSSNRAHLIVALIRSPTSVGFRVKPGMR
jgi:hypothetical protein